MSVICFFLIGLYVALWLCVLYCSWGNYGLWYTRRFGVRVDSQYSVSSGIPRPGRSHGNVHRNGQNNELGRLHHVRTSASYSTRLDRVMRALFSS